MNRVATGPEIGAPQGVRFTGGTTTARRHAHEALRERLGALALADVTRWSPAAHGATACAHVAAPVAADWAPAGATLALAATLGLRSAVDDRDLQREIVAAMLLAPRALEFPDHEEFESAVRMRVDTVRAGRATALEFDTEAIERPQDCWVYAESTGFTVRPGRELAPALRRALFPGPDGRRYAFSCYRASEYVMLLAIAEEAARSHPQLLARLQARFERRAVQSGEFHDSFLREFGSMDDPLPPRWFVPGDRVWFRNPDEHSADAEGYEGSWVVYLGGGHFTNFWKPEEPLTLTRKCVELYHWRHAAWRDTDGRLRIDEDEVSRRMAATLADPAALAVVLERMQRLRDPRGVYRDGGCMDTTREFPRFIRPGTCDMVLAPD